MPYCVSCGVELNPNAKVCPLCQTPVWHPSPPQPAAPYFPTQPAVVKPASKRSLALILTSMLVSVSFCCGLLNLLLPTRHPWGLYVIGGAMMLWIWFVLPLLARGMPMFLRLTLDVAAVGVYVYLIALGVHGQDWFYHLALPILAVACVVVFCLSFLLRGGRRSILTSAMLCIIAAALFCLGVEVCVDWYLYGVWAPQWSLITLVICTGLLIPLLVIRCVPLLREEVRRRFSL